MNRLLLCTVCYLFMILNWKCRKNEDTSAPYISIMQPPAGSTYSYLSTIGIKAHIRDNRQLQTIRVTITNASGQEFLQQINYVNEGIEKHIETSLVHSDLYLPGGTYYVTVTANDGENEMKAFREITLNEAPLVLEEILVAQQSEGDNFAIYKLENDALNFAYYFNGQLRHPWLDSRYDLLVYGDDAAQSILVYTAEDPTLKHWVILPGESYGDWYFNCIAQDPVTHDIFFGCDDHTLRVVNKNSNIGIRITLADNFLAQHIAITDDYIYLHNVNVSNTQQHIAQYHLGSGVFVQSLAIPMSYEITGLAEKNNDMIYVFGNHAGESLFQIYNTSTNALNDVFTAYSPLECSAVWQADDGDCYVLQGDFLIRYSAQLIQQNISNQLSQVTHVAVEKLSGAVYVSANDGVHVLNGSDLSEYAYYNQNNTSSVMFRYNK